MGDWWDGGYEDSFAQGSPTYSNPGVDCSGDSTFLTALQISGQLSLDGGAVFYDEAITESPAPTGVSQQGGGTPGFATFAAAQSAFQNAAKTIASKTFSAKCDGDFTAVGTTAAAVMAAAASVSILNAIGSSVSMASIYASSPVPQIAAESASMTGTVGQYVTLNPGTVAVAQLGKNNVYINADLINPAGYYQNLGTLLHELLHNVTGLTDPDIQGDLHLSQHALSNNITQKLIRDCF